MNKFFFNNFFIKRTFCFSPVAETPDPVAEALDGG